MNQTLRVGDTVKFSGPQSNVTETILSLQMEHTKVMEVESGETCGIKVSKPVQAGDILYLLTHHE